MDDVTISPETESTVVTIPESVPAVVTEPTVSYQIPETTEYVPTETVTVVTEPTQPVYLEVIQTGFSNIVHADLFGSFLVCGTLVGIFLLRGRYGT